jgi:hypothetical protein
VQRPSALVTQDPRAVDRVAQVLASTGTPGTFATRRTASADELRLDVVGVGPIPLPLSPASARRLCGIAHPARYGLREQTLLDPGNESPARAHHFDDLKSPVSLFESHERLSRSWSRRRYHKRGLTAPSMAVAKLPRERLRRCRSDHRTKAST